MTYIQLKQPNLSIIGQEGLCLAYVTEVFGIPNGYPSATVAWADAALRHVGEQPPSGVSVPVWFSYNGPDGHVAVATPQGIYSTSAQGDKVFGSISALVTWMGEGMTYLGWSEDINKVSVIEGEVMPTDAQIDQWISLFHQEAYGAAPSDVIFASWRPVLKNNFVDGSLSIMQGTDTNAGALKNKPTTLDKTGVETYIQAHLS